MQEFAVYAKANPGKLSYGSGMGQVVMEAIKKRLGLDIMRVPYKSNPSAVTDLIGNQVQVMVADFPNSVSHQERDASRFGCDLALQERVAAGCSLASRNAHAGLRGPGMGRY